MAHNVSGINIRQRMTQAMVLIIVIIAGILFSLPAEAQRGNRNSKSSITRHVSSKSKTNKACYVLYKKRTSSKNRPVLASARSSRKSKYKPMAETDQPARLASME